MILANFVIITSISCLFARVLCFLQYFLDLEDCIAIFIRRVISSISHNLVLHKRQGFLAGSSLGSFIIVVCLK